MPTKKIMLVEDDPMIAEIYQRKFESAGFDVSIASNGKDVLRQAKEQQFDLILLDMVLPELSGIDVLKELKQSGEYPADLKVIIFSNLSGTEIQQQASEVGADGFIGKMQFGPNELVKEVERALNEFAEQKKNKANAQKRAAGETIPKKGAVLLIEDEEIFLEMFGKKLEDDGYEVEYAKNGAWGMKEALQKDFDVIVTDIVMPAMGGDEIVRTLRNEERTKNIPIIVLSASAVDDKIKAVQEIGIQGFFVKTQIVPSDLSRKIEEILASLG